MGGLTLEVGGLTVDVGGPTDDVGKDTRVKILAIDMGKD